MAKRVQLHKLVQQAERLGRRNPLRARKPQLESIYDSINRAVFNGVLQRPKFILTTYRNNKWDFWGEIEVGYKRSRWGDRKTFAIRFARDFPNMKMMINTVAHEMVHQWEWERHGRCDHGQNFHAWNERLINRGIRL